MYIAYLYYVLFKSLFCNVFVQYSIWCRFKVESVRTSTPLSHIYRVIVFLSSCVPRIVRPVERQQQMTPPHHIIWPKSQFLSIQHSPPPFIVALVPGRYLCLIPHQSSDINFLLRLLLILFSFHFPFHPFSSTTPKSTINWPSRKYIHHKHYQTHHTHNPHLIYRHLAHIHTHTTHEQRNH